MDLERARHVLMAATASQGLGIDVKMEAYIDITSELRKRGYLQITEESTSHVYRLTEKGQRAYEVLDDLNKAGRRVVHTSDGHSSVDPEELDLEM